MTPDDKRAHHGANHRARHQAHHLARLNEMQRRTHERLAAQRRRVDERFARARARLTNVPQAPSSTQQRIIQAALALLDEEGLNELSLRKVAKRLDMQAPALYWHFTNKEVLIDYMAEAILQQEFGDIQPRSADQPWQDWLTEQCKRLRAAMRAHRDGARVVAGAHLFPAVTLLRLLETAHASLDGSLPPRQASLVISTAVHFTFGRVIEEQASPQPEDVRQLDMEGLFRDYPHFAQNVQQFLEDLRTGRDDFEEALRLIVGYPESNSY